MMDPPYPLLPKNIPEIGIEVDLPYIGSCEGRRTRIWCFSHDKKMIATWDWPGHLTNKYHIYKYKSELNPTIEADAVECRVKSDLLSIWNKSEIIQDDCCCGCKKEFPNTNIGHWRFCNYKKGQ